jgi:hypothetical protein
LPLEHTSSTEDANVDVVQMMDAFVEKYKQGVDYDEAILNRIRETLPFVEDARPLQAISRRLWTVYEGYYDIDTMIAVLRRWLELEPDSVEAKGSLGTLLYGHGPDWDEEAEHLLNEYRSAMGETASDD